MRPWVRVRAYPGLWSVVGLLTAALVFLTAAAGPVTRHMEDTALRQQLAQAPPHARDLVVSGPAEESATSAEAVRRSVRSLLPATLADAVDAEWGIQRTRIQPPSDTGHEVGQFASLAGDGVSTVPSGLLPLATVHHQTDLATAISVTDGTAPATEPAPDGEPVVIEVMAAADVARSLGLTVGRQYQLLPHVAAVLPETTTRAQAVTLHLTGVFTPHDSAAAVWQLDPRLLTAGTRLWPPNADDAAPVQQATLVTDQHGIEALSTPALAHTLPVENLARFTLDTARLDATWAVAAREAIVDLEDQPQFSAQMRLDTGLPELIDEFERQAAAFGTIAAMVTAGLIGTGIGLVLLAAGITTGRRRAEFTLLQARGAAVTAMAGRLLAETALVIIPAGMVGWLLHWALPGRADPQRLLGIGLAPLVVAALVLLTIPVTVTIAHHWRMHDIRPPARHTQDHRLRPVRITAELTTLLLAGAGVLLLHQRGLQPHDAYLLSVPVLLALAAGVLTLRIYPWLLRMLARLAAPLRGVAGFVGLAHAGRASVTALPLLVLVLAATVGTFAAGVHTSISAARDTAAVEAVGAHIRLKADALSDEAVSAAESVAGVEAVATVASSGFLRVDGVVAQNITVATIDAEAYQQVLAAIEAPRLLPEAITAATADPGTIPILVPTTIRPDHTLSVQIHGQEHPAEPAGDTTGLPALFGDQTWVLVPRHALPQQVPADELLIAGSGADPARLRDTVAHATGADPGALELTSLTQYRKEWDNSGFSHGITLIFIVGMVASTIGGLLAIALALAGQAAHHRQTLSLLHTMGMSTGQARRLLLVELLPPMAAAVAAGTVVGATMPALLTPALQLTEFTQDIPVATGTGLSTAVLIAAVLVLFATAGAVWQTIIHRSSPFSQLFST